MHVSKSTMILYFCLLTSFLLDASVCFTTKISRGPRSLGRSIESQTSKQRFAVFRRTTSARATVCFSSLSGVGEEIFVVSWDGVVAKSSEWRISQGLDVAFATWPHLAETLPTDDLGWLRNKMSALSHVMLPRPTLACDYALLARLLIEEQQLDAGRSTGASGKYAEKFHPQASDNSELEPLTSSSTSAASSRRPGNNMGSRPLTVGEIAANWINGGCLSETLLTRYHCNGQNPLPILQRNAEKLLRDRNYNVPEFVPFVCFALSSCAGKVIITTGHCSDVPMAQVALSNSGMPIQVANSVEDALHHQDHLVLLPRKSDRETSTLHQILRLAREGSTVYVIDSSFPILQKEKWLFGDDVPRSAVGRTCVGDHHHLSLNLAKWADNTHVSQQNEAEMDRWVNLITEEQFAELVSARIVKR